MQLKTKKGKICNKDKYMSKMMRNVSVKVTPELSAIVQKVAFDNGFVWHDGEQEIRYINFGYLRIYNYKHEKELLGTRYEHEDIVTLEEFLVELTKPAPKKFELVLNNDYTACIKNGKLTIGCQKFDLDVIDQLAKIKEKYLADQEEN